MKIKYVSNSLLRFLNKGQFDINKPINIYARNSIILPDLVDQLVNIYNGCKFTLIRVTPGMVGFKFGDFALPKLMTGAIHANSSKSKQNIKKGVKDKKEKKK
jgi:ribosomal protein S19